MTEVYSLSGDFSGNLNSNQLQEEIIAEGSITTTLLHIELIGDVVNIIFDSTASSAEKTTLNNLVSNHVPIAEDEIAELRIDDSGRVYQKSSGGKIYSFHDYNKEIIVDVNGRGHYTTIKEATNAHTTPGTIYKVMPGVYIEDNPLTIPQECFLAASGTSKQATIVAANPGNDIIHIGDWAKIDSFFLVGAYGPGSRAVYFNGTGLYGYSLVEECVIIDCDIGLEAIGSPGVLITNRTMVTTDPTTGRAPTRGIYSHNQGQITGWSLAVQGFQSPYLPVNQGLVCENAGSKLSVSTSNVYLANEATRVDDDGEIELNLLTERGNTTGLKVGSTGTASKVRANSLNILDSMASDLDIEATDADISLFSAEIDESKIVNNNKIKFASRGYVNKYNKKYQVLSGDIRVGGRSQRSTLSIGEGKYDDSTLVVFSNDNLEAGTWVDNSVAAVDIDPPVFDLFQSTNVGNCAYIGRDSPIIGFKVNVTTKTSSDVTKDDMIIEYWDGSNWVECASMNTMAESPYYCRDLAMVSYEEKQHIRIGLKYTGTPMIRKILNSSSNLYWVRLRVVNSLPSIPSVQYVHTHVNESKFNGNGFLEHFGNARPVRQLPLKLGGLMSVNSSLGNHNLYLSDRLGADLMENIFADDAVNRLGMNIFLPEDIDVSFPVKIKFAIVGTVAGSGDVELVCRWNTTNDGSTIYNDVGSAPSTSTGEKSYTTITTINAADTEFRGELYLDLSKINPCPELGNPELLMITLERDATSGNANDTYSGDVAFEQLTPFYISWRIGGYLESY